MILIYALISLVILPFAWLVIKNNPEKCVHLYEYTRYKIKCKKCGIEE